MFFGFGAAIYFLPCALADRFRYAGVAYEFIGVSLVATLVFKTMTSLGVVPLYKTWIPYFRRFGRAFYRPSMIIASVGSAQGAASASVVGTVEWPITGTLD